MLVELPGHVTARDASTSGEVPAGWPLEEYISLESMTTADGAEHRRLSSLIVQAFTPRRVAALRPRIERITADLLDDLAARAPDPVDLVAGYSYQLPMRVIGELFGTPTDRLDQLRAITRSLVSSTSTADEVDRTKGELVSYLADGRAGRRPHTDPVDRQQLSEDASGGPGAVTWMGNSAGELPITPITRG